MTKREVRIMDQEIDRLMKIVENTKDSTSAAAIRLDTLKWLRARMTIPRFRESKR